MINCWEQVKQHLRAKVSNAVYDNWLSKTDFKRMDRTTLYVAVPDDMTRQWMQQEYAGEVWTSIRDLDLPFTEVLYEVATPEHNGNAGDRTDPGYDELAFSPYINLNPKFTFETFVVGSCNQFAHAAAKAVATIPSKKYNPLLIYGGVGMGKTHLMHAIGRSLMDHYAGMKIIYTSSERFMNEMISSIKLDRMQSFHRHYRSADVLLMDDIQILAGKERTQEEFFHTFNTLFEHQKQIVISSDSPPKNIPGLVERLRSRFEWGLMVDVQPPDLETKMAILDMKSEYDGVRLPDDVRIFIATKTKTNVRELEGALVKLIAYSSVTGTPINLPMAQQVLKHLGNGLERKVTIDSIIKCVAEHYSLQVSQLKQKSNAQVIAFPRQVAMCLVKELTSASLPEIGRAFGGKHHTTVLHSVQKIERLRAKDPVFNREIQSLSDTLH